MDRDELQSFDFRGWPLSDEYLVEIGRVSALWGSLEGLIDLAIAKLAGFNDLGDNRPRILSWHSSIPQKFDMISALCDQLCREHPQLGSYRDVIQKMRRAQKLRNKFIHQSIVFDPDKGTTVIGTASFRGRVKSDISEVSVAEIRQASMAINEASRGLYELVLGRDPGPGWERFTD